MTDTHRIEIQVDSTSAVNASRNLNLLSGSVNRAERDLVSMSGAAKMATAALVGLAGVSFGKAIAEMASFETKLLQLKALTMANTEQMKAMEKQARVLGATTAFSAQQAAEAQGVLASAGLKVNEIMQATPKILQLAAAGSLDLAKAAEIATGTMKALGLGLSDLGRINDVFATVAANSSTNVQEIGEAMKNAAPLSRAFGVSLEMTAAAIGIAADNQIKGSEAGNNYKAMLVALGNDTKEHIEIAKKHGLTYADLDVKTRGLDNVMLSLGKANLSGAEALKLFGSDAAAMGLIMASNAVKLKESEAALHGVTGAAENQSDILNQGLAKAWDALKGSLSEAALQLGDSGVKGGLTDVIQAATGVIAIYEGMGEEFAKSNKLTAEQYKNLKDVAGELRGMAGAVGGIVAVTSAIWAAEKAVTALNMVLSMNPLVRMGMVVGAATGYVHEKLADNQSSIDKQIETSEKRISAMEKWGIQNMIGTAIGFDTEKERTKLTALKQYKEDQIALSKKAASATIQETEAQKALDKKLQDVEAGRLKAQSGYQAEPDKKAAAVAQREHNKELREYQQLLEKFNGKDPYKEYAKSMAELNSVQKDLSPETFLLNQQKIAAEFEKNTVDLKAYNDELERHKKYLENVGDYNSTIDELTRNKQRGAISQSEYGLGVAKANAGLMNDASNAYPNAKISNIPVEKAGEVIDAKNVDESAKALAKLNEQATKTIDSFNQLGDSGKMAFDGLLGGISAVASAASNFSDVMTKLNDSHNDYAKNYQAFIEDTTKSEADKASAKLAFEKENAAYQSKTFAAEISGARQVAGAASKMFGEKSAARKAFHAIEVGLSIIEMAISAKKMAMNLVETVAGIQAGAAQFFAQSGWAGFAGVAAMMAVMAGLGFAASSGGNKTIGAIPEYTKTTGTVLGDSEAQSKSVQNVSEKLEEIHAREYPELKNISSSMENFVKSIDKMLIVVARTGIDLQMINTKSGGFFGSTKVSTIGGGIRINEQSVADLQAGEDFDAQISSIVQTTKKSFFGGSKTRITEMLSGLDKSIGDGLSHVITSMAKNVASFWEYLGLDIKKGAEVIGSFSFSAYIKTFGMKDSEITDALKNWTSMTYDQMITHVLGGFVKQFQAMGESIGDTLGRLVVDANTVKNSFRNAGMQTKLTGEDLVIFSQQMIDATGGLKNFTQNMDTLISKFVSKETKANIGAENIIATLSREDVIAAAKGLEIDTSPATAYATRLQNNDTILPEEIERMGLQFLATGNSIKDTFEKQSAATNQYKKADFTTAYEQAFVHENPKASKTELDKINSLGVFATSGMSLDSSTTLEEARAIDAKMNAIYNHGKAWDYKGSGDDYFERVSPTLKKMFTENSATKAKGEKWLAENGYTTDRDALDTAAKAADKTLEPIKLLADAFFGLSDSTATVKDQIVSDSKVISGINESILQKITSADATKNRARQEKLLELSNETISKTGISASVLEGFNDWVEKTGSSLELSARSLQKYNNYLEDAAKITKSLADSSKYLIDFSRSIKTWVDTVKSTKIGTPTTQIDYAGKAFDDQLNIAKGIGSSAEEKRAALSGITGYADTFIESIKSYYGSSEEGMKLIERVVNDVAELGASTPIEQLQLGVLEQIKSGIYDLPTGLGAIFDSLVAQVAADRATYNTNPDIVNTLKLDADSKLVLSVINARAAGADGKLIDELLTSFAGDKGIQAQLDFIINSTTFDTGEKLSKIDEAFKGIADRFSKDTTAKIKTSYELLKSDLVSNPTELKFKNDDALYKIVVTATEIAALNNKDLLGKYVDLKISKAPAVLEIEATGRTLNDLLSLGMISSAKELLIDNYDAIKGIETTSKELYDLTKIKTDRVIEIDTRSALNNIQGLTAGFVDMSSAANAAALAAANAAQAAALAQAQAAQQAAALASGSTAALEAQAVNAGYSGDYTDIAAMQAFLNSLSSPSVAPLLKPLFDKYGKETLYREDLSSTDMAKLLESTGLGAISSIVKMGNRYAAMGGGVQVTGDYDSLPLFARGGIATQASIFGEAGAEAAVPLPDGRSIPVTLRRESANDSGETLAELKEQNKQLAEQNRNLSALITVMQANLQESRKQTDSLDLVKTKIRMGERA